MRRRWVIAAWVVVGAVVCGAVAFGLSWWLIDPHLEGADEYPGGVVLRDSAGTVLRVSLGPDDEDCRPYYVGSADDWIVKALVAAEDRRFFEHSGVNLPSVVRATFQNISSLRRAGVVRQADERSRHWRGGVARGYGAVSYAVSSRP